MIFWSAFVTVTLIVGAIGQEYVPSLDEYLLYPLPLREQLNIIDNFSVTNITTTPTRNQLPSKAQLMYYNYYSAVNYYYDLQNLTCEYCLKIKPDIANHTVLYNETYNTLSLVALSNTRQEIVVSFRGSANAMNLVLDFAALVNIRPSDSSNIKVHTGFYIATMSLYERVVLAIAEYRKNHTNYKIVITGLSLGGAMARMTFFFLKDRNQFPNAIYELYTFGEFRVGNRPFAEFMNQQNITSARVVNRADIIPHVPPVDILGTTVLYDVYVQPQTEYWINGNYGERFCNPTVFEDPTCSNSIGPGYTLIDHFKYFDVNIASAFAQPFQLASIPYGILPVELILPPLPKFIEIPLGDLLDFVIGDVLLPWLG